MKRAATIIVLLLLSLAMGCTQAMLAASATDREEHSIPLDPGGSVSLEGVNGNMTVRLADGKQVHIVAVKKVRALDQAKASEALAKLKVAVSSTSKEVVVETQYPASTGANLFGVGTFVSVDYTVEIPGGTRLKLSGVNGALDVEAAGSDVDCEVTNGSVRVEGARLLNAATVNGAIRFSAENPEEVSSTNGSVEGRILGLKPGAGKVETVNGHVTLSLLPGATVRLEVENVNGSVRGDLPGLVVEKHSLSGDLNGGGATLSVETVNGGIEIKASS